jgi:O-Antigen ligase
MSNASLLFRSLIIYAICLPLAVVLGYILADWENTPNFFAIIILLSLLMLPMLLRWHHLWLIALWNVQAVIFFLPGRPGTMLAMAAISLFISIIQHTLNRQVQFIHVPTIAWPIIFLTAVILVTAKLTGGIGLAIGGGGNVGGKKYLFLLGAIMGYYALTAHQIPKNKAFLYVALFFLCGLTSAISSMTVILPPSFLYYVLIVFPPDQYYMPGGDDLIAGPVQIARVGGIALACVSVLSAMLALYGVSGIFGGRKIWRPVVFLLFAVGSLFGGYRSILIGVALTFAMVFWLEGSTRTNLFPTFIICGIVAATVTLPFLGQMPLSVQRTLSFVPFVKIDSAAADAAKDSTEWRVQMWKLVLPEVPKYLLVGKGYSINAQDLAMVGLSAGTEEDALAGTMMSTDYHSGPLSLIIPFGLAGVAGFIWFLWAGCKVLRNNFRYGDPDLIRINTFLYGSFIAKIFFFIFIFGSFNGDLAGFIGLLGLSVAINGGMRRPVPEPKLPVRTFRPASGIAAATG